MARYYKLLDWLDGQKGDEVLVTLSVELPRESRQSPSGS
jgi:hypothetical protein